jgi:hypothetical protein
MIASKYFNIDIKKGGNFCERMDIWSPGVDENRKWN